MEKLIEFGKKMTGQRFLRYVVVGGTTFAIDLGLLILLHGVFGIDKLIAATISYWISIVFNFTVNRFWTFGAETSITQNATLYLTLLFFNYLFALGFLWLGELLGVHYVIAKILATGLQVAWTYFAYKKVVFR